ncbi:MAG: lytic transglycosylase domain-containing protein [Pseudomonadota bacterium]
MLALTAGATAGRGATTNDPAHAANATAAVCDQAARIASNESGVPVEVLRAVTRTETGRRLHGRLRPWPWTINMEGAGHWFDSAGEAIAYATRSHAGGARSFDMGCFQINYRWHGMHFDNLAEMMDPVASARYAARFLGELYRETGNWTEAVGRYHSRTPSFQQRYLQRYRRILAALPAMPDLALAPPPPRIAAEVAPARPEPERQVAQAPRAIQPPAELQAQAAASLAGLTAALPPTPGAVRLTQRVVNGGLLTGARPLFD